MIIHPNEISQGMAAKEQLIDVVIPNNFTQLLKKVSNAINILNNNTTAEVSLREQSFMVERDIHTAIIYEKTNAQPLFDLASVGYKNAKLASIKYLYTPKNENVDEYVVDLLTTYFEYEDETSYYQVMLPLYLIHAKEKLWLLPIQGENELVQASLEKIKIS